MGVVGLWGRLTTPSSAPNLLVMLIVNAHGSRHPSSKQDAGSKDAKSEPEAVEYRSLLIGAIHGCAVRFPEVAYNVVLLLMDFLNGWWQQRWITVVAVVWITRGMR